MATFSPVSDPLLDLVDEIGALLSRAHDRSGDERVATAAARVSALGHTKRIDVEARSLPVVDDWLGPACDLASPETSAVADLLRHAGERLAWSTVYDEQAGDAVIDSLLTGYTYAAIAGPVSVDRLSVAPFLTDDILLVVTLQAPGIYYPEHCHPAVEIYAPIGGTSAWLNGSLDWRTERPGAVFVHNTNETHAMTTFDEPLLTYAVWISDVDEVPDLAPRGGPPVGLR